MTYPYEPLLKSWRISNDKQIPPRTHTLSERYQLFNFPIITLNNNSTLDYAVEFLQSYNPIFGIENLYKNEIFNKRNDKIPLRVLDYNLGKDQKYARVALATDITDADIAVKEFLAFLKAEKSNINSKVYTNKYYINGTDENGIGDLYVEQKLLSSLPLIIDLNSDRRSNFSLKVSPPEFDYDKYLELFTGSLEHNQISGLGKEDWKNNFFINSNAPSIEWETKRADSITQDGEVFYDKKTASYCVSVLLKDEIYLDINDEKYNKIKRKGFNRIAEYLNLGTFYSKEKAYEEVNAGELPDYTAIDLILNNVYYDLVKIIDVYCDSDKKNGKIKFLVSVPHRHIARYINQYDNTGYRNAIKVAEIALSATDEIDGNKLLNSLLDNLTPENREKVNSILGFNLELATTNGLAFIREQIVKKIGNAAGFGSILVNGYDTLMKSLLGSSFNLDEPIDSKTPFIFFNLSKENLSNTKNEVDKFSKRILLLDQHHQKYLKKHVTTPTLSLPTISAGAKRLFEKLLLFSTDKVATKLSISEFKAEELLKGVAIYFENDPYSSFGGGTTFQDTEEYFAVIGIDILYEENGLIKRIEIGSTKKQEFSRIAELNEKNILFLYYVYAECQKYFNQFLFEAQTEKLKNYKKKEYQNFISEFIYPPLEILYTPSKEDEDATSECFFNVGNSLKKQFKDQTKNLRSSAFNSGKNFVRSGRKTADTASKLTDDKAEKFEYFWIEVASNIDINSLIAVVVECLRKKGAPIEQIEKLIGLILVVKNTKQPIACLLPPITLPNIPALNINLKLPVIDIVGSIETTILKLIKDIVNKLLADLVKSLLDNLIDCEGAFEDANGVNIFDEALKALEAPRDLTDEEDKESAGDPNPFGSKSQAVTATDDNGNPFENDTDGKSSSGDDSYKTIKKVRKTLNPPFNTKILDVILPYFSSVKEQDKKQLLSEFRQLIDVISANTTSAEFFNLLIGNPSKATTIFIIDTILADSQDKYKIIDSSKVLDNKEGIAEVFSNFASLIDQDVLQTVRDSIVKVNTDINALCIDVQQRLNSQNLDNLSERERLDATLGAINKDDLEVKIFKTKNFLDEQVKAARNKKLAKDEEIIKNFEKLLIPGSFNNAVPSLKPTLNPDGTIKAGLLPVEPLDFQMKAAAGAVNAIFDNVRKVFNTEVSAAKLTAISTVSKKRLWNEQKAKKMFPDYDDLKKKAQDAKRIYYTNELVVNPDLKKALLENVNFGPNSFKTKLVIPKPQINMTDIQNDDQIPSEVKQKISFAMTEADKAIAKVNNYVNMDIVKGQNPLQINYNFDIKHIILGDMQFSITDSISQASLTQSNFNDFSNINFPQVENSEQKLKIFSKILFANNIKINLDRRNGQVKKPINFQNTANLYEEIFNSIIKTSNDKYVKDILDSPLMNVTSSADVSADAAKDFPPIGRPNVLSLKLESKQSQACLDKGFPDTHLLKTDDLKKQVMDFYKKFGAFDKDKPTDGSQTDELNALEKARLYATIELFFRVFVAEYLLRGIYVFGKQKLKNINKELISSFLYFAFLKEKKLNRFKKITKNYKFLYQYYKDTVGIDTTDTEVIIKYLIKKNIDSMAESIDKKIKAANFSINEKESDSEKTFLDDLIGGLPFVIVDDTTKKITFNSRYYIDKFLSDTSVGKDLEVKLNETKFVVARKPSQKTNEYYLCALTNKTDSQLNVLDPFEAFQYKIPQQNNNVLLTVLTKIKLKNDYTLDKSDQVNKLLEANFSILADTKQTLSYLTILTMSQISLIRDVDRIFNITKITLLTNIEFIINNGFYYKSEYAEQDAAEFSFSVIIKAALNIPKVVIKALAEILDPNIAISSKVSLGIKIIKELLGAIPQPDVQETVKKIPDIPVPVISLPLGFTFPFFFTPLTIIYLILCGFDFDSDEKERSEQSKLAEGQFECEKE